MSLSSEWSSSVVVRAERSGGTVVTQPLPNNSSARAYATAGNPILVRSRDPTVFTASGDSGAAGGGGGEGGSSSPASGVLARVLGGRDISETFWVPDASKGEMGLLETLHRRGASNRTFVLLQSRPLPELQFNFSTCTGMNVDLSHNAFRLSKTATALQSMDAQLRPFDEDAFSADHGQHERFIDDATGEVFYQAEDGNYYPVESAGAAADRGKRRQQPASPGGGKISMSTKSFKTVLRASLQSLQEEDYYLVKYRDYSAWATSSYRSIAKADTMFGRKYVEQCFAVHVGREPGELVPITEAQFLFGVDILQRQLLNQLNNVQSPTAAAVAGRKGVGEVNKHNYMQYQVDINYSALNADQFRALGALLGDGLRPVGVEFEEKKKAEEDARAKDRGYRGGSDPYEAPAWYDWTPGAVRRRVRHQLETYYVSVGRLAVQFAVIGVVGFFAYRAVKDYVPSLGGGGGGGGGDGVDGRRRMESSRGRRGGRYNDDDDGFTRRRSRKRYWFPDDGDDEGYEYVKRGFLRSVLMGPKEVLDYMLAPTGDG